jgi:hypothetical protein
MKSDIGVGNCAYIPPKNYEFYLQIDYSPPADHLPCNRRDTDERVVAEIPEKTEYEMVLGTDSFSCLFYAKSHIG